MQLICKYKEEANHRLINKTKAINIKIAYKLNRIIKLGIFI